MIKIFERGWMLFPVYLDGIAGGNDPQIQQGGKLFIAFRQPFIHPRLVESPFPAGPDSWIVRMIRPCLLNENFRSRCVFFYEIVNILSKRKIGIPVPALMTCLLNGYEVPVFGSESCFQFCSAVVNPADFTLFLGTDIAPVTFQFAPAEICPLKMQFAAGRFRDLWKIFRQAVRETVASSTP